MKVTNKVIDTNDDRSKKINFLFKTKNTNKQSANNNGQGGDKQHNTVEGKRMYSRTGRSYYFGRRILTQKKQKPKRREEE
jgi:hypothetical protein